MLILSSILYNDVVTKRLDTLLCSLSAVIYLYISYQLKASLSFGRTPEGIVRCYIRGCVTLYADFWILNNPYVIKYLKFP